MTKPITIENAELSITIDGTSYSFDNVTSITIADPRENTMVASPQGKGNGLTYRTGTSSAIAADFIVRDVPADLFEAVADLYNDQGEFDCLLFDNLSGDEYTFDSCIMRTNPSNRSIAEGEGSFDVPVAINCTPNNFKHKVGA